MPLRIFTSGAILGGKKTPWTTACQQGFTLSGIDRVHRGPGRTYLLAEKVVKLAHGQCALVKVDLAILPRGLWLAVAPAPACKARERRTEKLKISRKLVASSTVLQLRTWLSKK